MDNISWQLGDVTQINFWKDNWLSSPIADQLQIPSYLQQNLHATVSEFIINNNWSILVTLAEHHPALAASIAQITIPILASQDQIVWSLSDSGLLSSKEAFHFLNPHGPRVPLCKLIWHPNVPPSMSFLFWRLMHRHMPTDDNLWARGCTVVTMCSLCEKAVESAEHLFLACPFTQGLWNWLMGTLCCNIDLTSFETVLYTCNKNWSKQVGVVVLATILNVFWVIWLCRNKLRFDNKQISSKNAIILVTAAVA